MFYYLHLLFLAPIYWLVSSLLWREQEREILFLRQQLLIMQRQRGRKLAYGRLEKLALLLAALRLSKQRLTSALLIVRPDTLLRWHREVVRRHWSFRPRAPARKTSPSSGDPRLSGSARSGKSPFWLQKDPR